jgi:hypothetical protein
MADVVDNGEAVERGTAVGVLRDSRSAGFAPEDAILFWLEQVSCCCEEQNVTRGAFP